MSLEDLRRAIYEKARIEAEGIIKEAREKAKMIIKEAEERKKSVIMEERERILNEVEFEVRLAEARREAKLIIVKAKYEVVEELKKKVWELIKNMSEEDRLKSLEILLRDSVEVLKAMGVEPNDVIIRVNPRDRKLIKLLLSRIGIRGVIVEDRLMSGGVIVMSGNGDISVDNSYETRLEACLRELLPKIFKG